MNQRVSIVVPVYNEAGRIGDCLRTIAAQVVQPYEVIVVDNNSTDETAAIAARFPFVRLVKETRQGVVYARRRGFDEARGNIIGSVDADTDVPPDWVAMIQQIFAETDADAIAGSIEYRDIAWAPFVSRIDLGLRRYFARIYEASMPLQGANMALRRDAWLAVRDSLCVQAGLHEDMDLAAHLGAIGRSGIFDERLRAKIGFRQCALDWDGFCTYAAANPRSYSVHGVRTRSMWLVVIIGVSLYPLLRILHQGYDRTQRKFSWVQLVRGDLATRVNPVTFMD